MPHSRFAVVETFYFGLTNTPQLSNDDVFPAVAVLMVAIHDLLRPNLPAIHRLVASLFAAVSLAMMAFIRSAMHDGIDCSSQPLSAFPFLIPLFLATREFSLRTLLLSQLLVAIYATLTLNGIVLSVRFTGPGGLFPLTPIFPPSYYSIFCDWILGLFWVLSLVQLRRSSELLGRDYISLLFATVTLVVIAVFAEFLLFQAVFPLAVAFCFDSISRSLGMEKQRRCQHAQVLQGPKPRKT